MSGWEVMPAETKEMPTSVGSDRYNWVWDGEYVALAQWVPWRWHMGTGRVYDTCEITHYHALVPPLDPNKESGWDKSPPNFIPFSASWCWDGKDIFLAYWQGEEWVTTLLGSRFDPAQITHYQLLKAPDPPIETKKLENYEVNYADL